MSSSTKPTIVIIPGAWCPSSIYEPLTSRLRNTGYKVHPLDLPSNGDPPTLSPDWQPDLQTISTAIQTHADEGEDVLVVAHSAGGASASQAVQGLSKEDRQAEGKLGGVIQFLMLAAFTPAEGPNPNTVEDLRQLFPWVVADDEIDYPHPDRAAEILFNDLPSDQASEMASRIQKSAWKARHSVYTTVTYAGWKHIPSSYLLCENDNTVVPQFQEMMIAQEGGKFDDVVRLPAGHFPFISQPDFVARFVRRAAGERDLELE